MKRVLYILLTLIITTGLIGCDINNNARDTATYEQQNSSDYTFTDSLGNTVTVNNPKRVVSLYGSFAETWLLAGGKLVGTTKDAVEERDFGLKDVDIIGTVQEPNLEEIMLLNPDFIIMSADITKQVQFKGVFDSAGIPYAYFRVDTGDDYLKMMRTLCDITGRDDLYKSNGVNVISQVDDVIYSCEGKEQHSILLIRAFSNGVKAKLDDNVAGVILRDLNTYNIAEKHPSLLDELSLEEVVAEDPYFIFVVPIGDTDEAYETLKKTAMNNPAWSELSAVKNDRFIILPKELFHYKPNSRWGESYEYMAEILYGD